MIKINGTEYNLTDPKMAEYRSIIEFSHAQTKKPKPTVIYKKLLNLVSIVYGRQFSVDVLQRAVDANLVEYDESLPIWDVIDKKDRGGINDIFIYGNYLATQRTHEIGEIIGNHTNINKADDHLEPPKSMEDLPPERAVQQTRRNLLEWYKSLSVDNQVMSWVEIDSMYVYDFEDFKQAIAGKPQKLAYIKDDELAKELNITRKGGDS